MSELDDEPASELERAEAEALSRALDGRFSHALPDDALQVAALLRHVEGEVVLDPGRSEQILADVLGASPGPARRRKQAAARVRRAAGWSALVVGAAAALATIAWFGVNGDRSPIAGSAAEPLPLPSVALLAAQADAMRDRSKRRALDFQMQPYRERVLRGIEARYPSPVSALVPGKQGPR